MRRLTAVLIAVLLAVVPLAAERYTVTVTRISTNLYEEIYSKTLIQTSLCLELALMDDAILNWEGRGGRNWILFTRRGGEKCDVIALR